MNLTDEDVKKFQAVYLNEFGREISREIAYEQGIKLLRLMSVIYQPMTKRDFNRIQRHRKTTMSLLTK